MASVNKCIIIGNLGQDPELNRTGNGVAVCNINIATSRKWNDKDDNLKEETEWHRVTVWGKQAEACKEYLAKGRQVYVEGRLHTREWEDKEGNKRTTVEIIAENVQFLGNRNDSGGSRSPSKSTGRTQGRVSDDDGIPF